MANKTNDRRFILFLVLGLTILALWLGSTLAARAAGPIVVTSLADTTGPCAASGTGACTLRDALTFANANAGADSITFDPGVSGTITLSTILPAISGPLTIDGGSVITISGAGAYQVLVVNSGVSVNLQALTIARGYSGTFGAGVKNSGTLTVNNSVFTDNSGHLGAGIFNTGALVVANSAFISNTADNGGGIANLGPGAAVTITNSSFVSNTALSNGGSGLFNFGPDATAVVANSRFSGNRGILSSLFNENGGALVVTDSTFSDNSGRAIANENINSTAVITNGTFTGNHGGAIENTGALTLTASLLLSNTTSSGAGIDMFGSGSSLVVINSTFVSNTATAADGGAIENTDGVVTVSASTFMTNSAHKSGGAIISGGLLSHLIVTGSTFSGNTAHGDISFGGGDGGAIESANQFTVTSSTFFSNTAAHFGGGGIYNYGPLALTNSTFSANSGASGGAIYNDTPATLTVTNSTLVSNTATSGGGINNAGALLLRNTLVAGSPSGSNCVGPLTADSHNLADDHTCASAAFTLTAALQLGPLQDNGGSTATIALGPGSAAIDAGDIAVCPAVDQRGFLRVGACDVGAYEVGYRLLLPLVLVQP